MLKTSFLYWRQKLKGAGRTNADVFDAIYRNRVWKGPGEISSGLGSTPKNTREYEDLIVEYIEANQIRSMLDIGCGDHQVSQRILERVSWPVDYVGMDVSSVAIAHNERKFASESVRFFCADAAEADLPPADLVVVREVLQHIPNADIAKILPKLRRFPHAIITNAQARHAQRMNVDIAAGSNARAALNSGLDFTQPPFSVPVAELRRTAHQDRPTEIVSVRLLPA